MITARLLPLIASIPSPGTDRIQLGPLTFRFYGLMIALGVLAAVEISRRRWAARGGHPDDIIEVAKWAVPAGLIGTRIYHVATDWKSYRGDWGRAFEIWNGGLGIPGGLALGVLVGAIYVKRQGWDVGKMIDAAIPSIPVAQAIGRLGNWFNQEIYGRPTDVPWALEIDEVHRTTEFKDFTTFHPVFLYEALWNLGLAWFLIKIDARKVLKKGQILPLWIVGYGVGRFIVEGMRTDAASLVLGIRINHWISAAAVLFGGLWFWALGRRNVGVEDPHDLDELELGVGDDADDSLDLDDNFGAGENDAGSTSDAQHAADTELVDDEN